MAYRIQLLAALSIILYIWQGHAQMPIDVSIIPKVELGSNPLSVTLTWDHTAVVGYDYTDGYFIIRRSDNAYNFSADAFVQQSTIPINNFANGNTFSYTDNNSLQVGVAYEYHIRAQLDSTRLWQPIEGFVIVGKELPLIENRGHVILVIERSMGESLVDEIQQLKMDLIGDGWEITSIFVNSADSVVDVKSAIATAHGTREKSTLYLIGRVPVPYSGNEAADGHGDHKGAWPADSFYTSLVEDFWTDDTVNNPNAADPRNQNVPGDGKYDETYVDGSDKGAFPVHMIPYVVAELEVGRVYLGKYNQIDELTAMKYYFKKNHGYRFREANFTFDNKALLNDDFKWLGGEAPSAPTWRTYPQIVGMENVYEGKLVTDLKENSALLAGAFGYGTFSSILNTGTTDDILSNIIRAGFLQVYGSYLCDWDSDNNILRSPLLGSHGLGVIQSGRPYSFLHMTTTGKHIGFATHMSLTHDYKYFSNTETFMVHSTLQGDPTLRFFIIDPPSNVQAQQQGNGMSLSWTASSDQIIGYHVYRATSSIEGPYSRVTTSPVSDTTFVDVEAVDGTNYYMVRAVQLTQTPATSFYNPSQAAFATATFTRPPAVPAAPITAGTPLLGPGASKTPQQRASSASNVLCNVFVVILSCVVLVTINI